MPSFFERPTNRLQERQRRHESELRTASRFRSIQRARKTGAPQDVSTRPNPTVPARDCGTGEIYS